MCVCVTSWNTFSKQQKWVICCLVNEKRKHSDILDEWNRTIANKLYPSAMITILRRSAMGFEWKKGVNYGGSPYLCNEDMKILYDEIANRARTSHAFDTSDILPEVMNLKLKRIEKAIEFLKRVRSTKLVEQYTLLLEEIEEPCRSWINTLSIKIKTKLAEVRYLDKNRFISCTPQIIDNYFDQFQRIFAETPKPLFFVADETMIDLNRGNKVIIPLEDGEYITHTPWAFRRLRLLSALIHERG